MLCFDRIDVSEDININKTVSSKECIICNYWYFLDKGNFFRYCFILSFSQNSAGVS